MFGYGDEDKPEIDWETVKQVKENLQNYFFFSAKRIFFGISMEKCCFVFTTLYRLSSCKEISFKKFDLLNFRNL